MATLVSPDLPTGQGSPRTFPFLPTESLSPSDTPTLMSAVPPPPSRSIPRPMPHGPCYRRLLPAGAGRGPRRGCVRRPRRAGPWPLPAPLCGAPHSPRGPRRGGPAKPRARPPLAARSLPPFCLVVFSLFFVLYPVSRWGFPPFEFPRGLRRQPARKGTPPHCAAWCPKGSVPCQSILDLVGSWLQ